MTKGRGRERHPPPRLSFVLIFCLRHLPAAVSQTRLSFVIVMLTIGITGGIASGKSTFTQIFAATLGVPVFDADVCARRLLAEDAAVAAEVHAAFGAGVFGPDGRPERAALRAVVFDADPAPRRTLEAILHPRVREAWRGWLEERLQASPNAPACVEIPLLYETGAEVYFDHIIVVGCGLATQLARLTGQRGLPEAVARRIIDSQWALPDKIRRADHLIWNDGSEEGLRAQAARCARYFQEAFV